MGKVVEQMREEIQGMETDRDKLVRALQDRKRDQETHIEGIRQENSQLKDIVQQLNQENTRMSEERQDKDRLLKELTNKNLEIVSQLQNLESTL
jgi:predicted RNase H-like nuclease (RuvC/YqgF family)